jgi:hypothetical protein
VIVQAAIITPPDCSLPPSLRGFVRPAELIGSIVKDCGRGPCLSLVLTKRMQEVGFPERGPLRIEVEES